jgi:hypothetical protein
MGKETTPQYINDIEKVVNYYHNLKRGYNDIETLINCRKSLSTCLYYMAKDIANAYETFKGLESLRKMNVEKKRYELISAVEKVSAAAAEAQAAAQFADIREQENVAETIWKRFDLHYKSTEKVIDSLNQHIAHLRGEKQSELKGQGSQ